MKLSRNTVTVLKNFSNINQNILVKEGDTLHTMSTMKNILAEAPIKETFPRQFGIYDLNEFLGVLTLVNDAELEFDSESHLTVNGGNVKIKYWNTSLEQIKDIQMDLRRKYPKIKDVVTER